MNENTAKLLEQLANKMGTTSEYLWKILLRQAPIDATITLIQYMVLIIVGIVIYKVHQRLSKPIKTSEYSTYNSYDESDAYGIMMIFGSFGYLIIVVVAFFSIGSVINGYFNPEYWALDQLLSAIRPSN